MDELQRRYLQLILEETGWNRRRAAAVLDLDRRTIQRLIARYQLQGAVDPEGEDELETEEESRKGHWISRETDSAVPPLRLPGADARVRARAARAHRVRTRNPRPWWRAPPA